MSQISLPRFGRLLMNDTLRVARPVLYTTVTLLAVTVLQYLFRFSSGASTRGYTALVVFGSCLFSAGLYLTSVAFKDMHHPLERNHYLMLPVSNLERLFSRYLLTGPLLILCAIPAFMVFDHVANNLTAMWIDKREPPFSPFTAATKWMLFYYMLAHAVVLTGAVCFRSYALLKSMLFLVLVGTALVLVENAAGRIFFPGDYSWTQFDSIRPAEVAVLPWFAATWMNVMLVTGIYIWTLYIAYLCLRDHEA
jgi:hypothetical protein